MKYRRAQTKGGTFFFTVVTLKREPILTESDNVQILRKSFKNIMVKHSFKIDAFVLLPDHLHCIWKLPDGDHDFSTRWRLIKSDFTRRCDNKFKFMPLGSRADKKEQTIWQRRFWEHQIRDEEDFQKHVEYIHYNPVKHKYVSSPKDWEFSSFHKYVREEKYQASWGSGEVLNFDKTIGNE
ncbi:MAG: transposase [Desulfobacterales bacterium]|jgi:putative transposase|nr:transposase [Desulfobacterales bacterium]